MFDDLALNRLHTLTYELAPSSDPDVVFSHFARLCVPDVCDAAEAAVLMDGRLLDWEQEYLAGAVDESATDAAHPGTTRVTVHITSLAPEDDGWTGDLEYVAVLTLLWRESVALTSGDVAMIKLAGRCAAGVVHQAQQGELVAAQQVRINDFRAERERRRVIDTAAGFLMGCRDVSYDEAVTLLDASAAASGVHPGDAAAHLLRMGRLPDELG